MGITSGAVSMFFSFLQGLLSGAVGPVPYINYLYLIVALVIYFVIVSIVFSIFSYVFGWIERKVMARAQSRHGPTYVGKYGFLQNLADLIKLLAKENIVPDGADRPVFLTVIPALLAVFVLMLYFIPFTQNFVGLDTSVALLIVFMLLSFTPMLVFLAGWTSNNKFGSIAAQRSVLMMLSYEIPLVLVVAAVALLAKGYSFMSVVNAQAANGWFAFLMPIGLVVFFVALLGELDRPPFDLREADSELIAGWLTDVSAPYYGLVLFLDYVRILVGVLLISVLFFGGWLGPSFLPGAVWLAIKVVALTVFIIFLRATTVRMRLDKLLRLGWQYLMPLSVVNLLITFIIYFIVF